MSIYQKASLVQIPSGYKAADDKLYSVVPSNGDGDFTIDSSPLSTRVNKDGLIESVATDQARLNYDFTNPQDPHLLLEPSRTNECLYSKTLSSWSELSGGSLQTITDNDAVAPDGSLTASTITFTGTGISLLRQFTNKAYTSNKHSSSFYAKKISGNGSVFFGITDTETEFTPTDEWVRYEVNDVTPSDFGVNLFLDLNFDCSAGDKIAVWGMQLEEGTYSTSIIETSGSAVTRTVDFCFINSGLQNVLNTSEGTLFVDLEVPRVATTSDFDRIVLSDQNSSTDRLIFDNFGGNWRVLLLSSGNNVNKTVVNVTANQRIKIAIAYSATGLRISYDGNTPTTTSGTYAPTTTLESFKFSNKDGGSKVQGKIYQAIYFNTALSDSELQTLTS